MTHLLRAFVLLVWSIIVPGLERTGDAGAIADALVDAVLEDAPRAPVYSSHLEDLAAGAFQAFRESSLQATVEGDCDPVTGVCKARGPWQLHGECRWRSLPEQARCWLRLLHDGAAMCPQHPLAAMWGSCSGPVVTPTTGGGTVTLRIEKLAAKRERRVRELTQRALGTAR
jgi:hypothetical protein